MIIVTGSVDLKPESLQEGLELCHSHVAQSLSEHGCISHAFYIDAENPFRLFFFEQWEDESVLKAHFTLNTSQQFVASLRNLCSQAPALQIFGAEQIQP